MRKQPALYKSKHLSNLSDWHPARQGNRMIILWLQPRLTDKVFVLRWEAGADRLGRPAPAERRVGGPRRKRPSQEIRSGLSPRPCALSLSLSLFSAILSSFFYCFFFFPSRPPCLRLALFITRRERSLCRCPRNNLWGLEHYLGTSVGTSTYV